MPTFSDRIWKAVLDTLTAVFSSLTRKLCVLVLDGDRVMRFDARSGGFIDEFVVRGSGIVNSFGMCLGLDGNLLVPTANAGHTTPFPVGIQRFDGANGGFIDTFAPWPLPFPNSPQEGPDCITLGPDGHLYAAAGTFLPFGRPAIYRFNAHTGAFIDVFVAPGAGGMECPGTLRFGPDGNLYVRNCASLAPMYGLNILRFNGKTGAFIDVFVPVGDAWNFFGGMAFGPDGHLYISELAFGGVRRYDGTTGARIGDFVPQGTANFPCGLTFAGDLYVTNRGGFVANQRYGNVSRYNGQTGALVQVYERLGADHIFPTDVLVTVADVPFPNFSQWQFVPRWLQVIFVVVIGAFVGRLIGPRSRR